jgi:hypothetical protein
MSLLGDTDGSREREIRSNDAKRGDYFLEAFEGPISGEATVCISVRCPSSLQLHVLRLCSAQPSPRLSPAIQDTCDQVRPGEGHCSTLPFSWTASSLVRCFESNGGLSPRSRFLGGLSRAPMSFGCGPLPFCAPLFVIAIFVGHIPIGQDNDSRR